MTASPIIAIENDHNSMQISHLCIALWHLALPGMWFTIHFAVDTLVILIHMHTHKITSVGR
jgi:hypothetical protein